MRRPIARAVCGAGGSHRPCSARLLRATILSFQTWGLASEVISQTHTAARARACVLDSSSSIQMGYTRWSQAPTYRDTPPPTLQSQRISTSKVLSRTLEVDRPRPQPTPKVDSCCEELKLYCRRRGPWPWPWPWSVWLSHTKGNRA